MEYFTFPLESLNVSQRYYDSGHIKHMTGTPKDYPIDIVGGDKGLRNAAFARVDLKVLAKRGEYQSGVTNTVWLQTVNPVKTPTFEDYAFMTITHWNDTDSKLSQYNVGDIIPKGQITDSFEIQGQDRSLWVYPLKWALTFLPPTGSLTNFIKGGHAKLKEDKTIEIYYYPNWI